jgi:potassium/hydrogen antiporter
MEAPTSIEIAKQTLLFCGLILTIGTITALFAQKIKIPDIALFLIVGMVIGPEALGLITIKADSPLSQIILLFGASYILFDGGASLRFNVLKQVWITIFVISTAGLVVTATLTGIAAYYVPGADRRAVGKCARRLDEVITEQTRRLIIADHRPIDHDLL